MVLLHQIVLFSKFNLTGVQFTLLYALGCGEAGRFGLYVLERVKLEGEVELSG